MRVAERLTAAQANANAGRVQRKLVPIRDATVHAVRNLLPPSLSLRPPNLSKSGRLGRLWLAISRVGRLWLAIIKQRLPWVGLRQLGRLEYLPICRWHARRTIGIWVLLHPDAPQFLNIKPLVASADVALRYTLRPHKLLLRPQTLLPRRLWLPGRLWLARRRRLWKWSSQVGSQRGLVRNCRTSLWREDVKVVDSW